MPQDRPAADRSSRCSFDRILEHRLDETPNRRHAALHPALEFPMYILASAGCAIDHDRATCVLELQFPRQRSFGHARHADDIAAITRHPFDLRGRLEPRPLGDAVYGAVDDLQADTWRRAEQALP